MAASLSTLVTELSNSYDYCFRFSGFPDLFGKVPVINQCHSPKAGLTLNDFYDTTFMIQYIVWLFKIANSRILDVQIEWVLFFPTCTKETNQSHFTFCNAEFI